MKRLFLLAALAGCHARESAAPAADAPDRLAGLSILRLGQAHLGGALEVTRLSRDLPHLAVGVTNRTGSELRLRWRFRYIDSGGWERRSRDSAEWKQAVVAAGEEWAFAGEAEVGEAQSVGMDWRYEKE
ncbi:MAG: hypothetical protein K8T20_16000 [Planctomycetes bacterium]|nr:hypothetical protein [Planctomycetota bacterium]